VQGIADAGRVVKPGETRSLFGLIAPLNLYKTMGLRQACIAWSQVLGDQKGHLMQRIRLTAVSLLIGVVELVATASAHGYFRTK
jgi:hypothetical protein